LIDRDLIISFPKAWAIDASKARAILASAAPIVRIVRHINISWLKERERVTRRAKLRVAASSDRSDIRILFRWITKLIRVIAVIIEITGRVMRSIIFII
jgi:hypothetical protein